MTKFNKIQREKLKTMYKEENMSMSELALRYGASTSTIFKIIHEPRTEILSNDTSPDNDKRIDIIKLMLHYRMYTRRDLKERFGITIESMDAILDGKDVPFEYELTPRHLEIIREKYNSGWTIKMIANDIRYHPFLIEEIVTFTSKFLTPFIREVPLRWSGQTHIVNLYLTGKYSTQEIAFIIATTPYDVGQVITHRGQADKDRARTNREKYLATK